MRRRLSTIVVICLTCFSLMLTYMIHRAANPRNLLSQRAWLLQPLAFIHGQSSIQSHRPQPRISPRPDRTNILILSSLGRSGSSFLADLVASHGGNIYFFEPIRPIAMINATRDVAAGEIARYFDCIVRENLFSLRAGDRTIYLKPPADASSKCSDGVLLRKDETAARIACELQKVVIVKTIRMRLSWAREMMDDERLHLKMIHLVRDPRAVMLSMRDSKWGKADEDNTCPFMLQDLQYMEEMETRFPDRYFFLRYEDLCTNLEEEARRIFRFLGVLNDNNIAIKGKRVADQKLPPCVQEFIASHTMKGDTDQYSTFRDTIHTYQRWRNHIKQNYLTYAERRCREVITILGYNLFDTVDNARDLNIPVLNQSNAQYDSVRSGEHVPR